MRVSIHAPRVGSDTSLDMKGLDDAMFQSTLPVWGATEGYCSSANERRVSIHAPRVGSDGDRSSLLWQRRCFNPRSPCGERHVALGGEKNAIKFQSTLPVWGATLASRGAASSTRRFNPRSPCGERLTTARANKPGDKGFNPRSPCGERP